MKCPANSTTTLADGMIIIDIDVSFTLLLGVMFFSNAAGGYMLVIRLNCYMKKLYCIEFNKATLNLLAVALLVFEGSRPKA